MRQPPELLAGRMDYRFRDGSLLMQALTHRSAGSVNNERLEFLGDAILGFVVADALFERFPDATEGQLSRLRAALVKKDALAETARSLELGSFLHLGPGELRTGGHARASILADALEALIAAVYLDGDEAEAKRIILALLQRRIDSMTLDSSKKDAKTRLQEYLQGRQLDLPVYEITRVEGEDHQQRFYCSCSVTDLELIGAGDGSSRRRAEQAAATDILRQLPHDA